MGLKPVFDSSDAFFNAEAAQAAYDLVMKMDMEEARASRRMAATARRKTRPAWMPCTKKPAALPPRVSGCR